MKYFEYIAVKLVTSISPSYWLMLDDYSHEWDKSIRSALKSPEFSDSHRSGCSIALNGVKLWICNYPYSYGHSYDSTFGRKQVRPSRTTIWYLRRAIDRYQKETLGSIA